MRERDLGLMMREGLLKENIDGEALDWAHKRLLGRTEQRKILMMISDGAPVDDSDIVGQSRQLSGAASALCDRGHRNPFAGGADCDRHRPRRHPLLSPRGDDRRLPKSSAARSPRSWPSCSVKQRRRRRRRVPGAGCTPKADAPPLPPPPPSAQCGGLSSAGCRADPRRR